MTVRNSGITENKKREKDSEDVRGIYSVLKSLEKHCGHIATGNKSLERSMRKGT